MSGTLLLPFTFAIIIQIFEYTSVLAWDSKTY